MDSRDMDSHDWRCKHYEADCIRRFHTDKRIAVNVLLGHSASTWIKDWTLYGIIHLHKLVTGQDKPLDWYKHSWDLYLRTDPDCVRVKQMCELYIKN